MCVLEILLQVPIQIRLHSSALCQELYVLCGSRSHLVLVCERRQSVHDKVPFAADGEGTNKLG